MKSNLKLSSKINHTVSVKRTVMFISAGLCFLGLLFTGAFFYFNFGDSEEALAENGNYSTARDGSWNTSSTWKDWSNPSFNNIPNWNATFNLDHHVTNGDLKLKSGNKLIISGTLEVNSIESQTQLTIEITETGKLIVNESIKNKDNSTIVNNGILEAKSISGKNQLKIYNNGTLNTVDIKSNDQLKIYNSGSLQVTNDIDGKSNFDLYNYENASLLANNITGNNQLKIYNSGKLEVKNDIKGKSNFDLYNYENASIKVNNISADNQFKIYNTGEFASKGSITGKDNFSIKTSETFEVGSINAGNQFSIDNDGMFISRGDIQALDNTAITSSRTLIVIGDIESGNQLKINNGGETVITGNIVTGNNLKSYEEELYLFGDVTNGTYPSVEAILNDRDLEVNNKELYDLVQRLLNGGLLPIVLDYFKATATKSNFVLLEWGTFSEQNNDFFTLERSIDGKTFQIITTIEGAGSSNKKRSYSFEDTTPVEGMNYYRLKQTDFNGEFEYFKIIAANLNNQNYVTKESYLSAKNIQAGPNPFKESVTITYTTASSDPVALIIRDITGTTVYKETLYPSTGENQYTYDRANQLKPGVYIINMIKGGKTATVKAIKI